VRYVRILTIVIMLLGAALMLAAIVGGGDPMLLIAGIMMLWAGVVKIVVAVLWRKLGTPDAVRAREDSYR
jgi:hypothetical protein